ncbi:UbiA family prenyltransferase, partial [Streptomyces sp. A7024]|nr:UbiA family prenyltransferase [Streptomyces coryli]
MPAEPVSIPDPAPAPAPASERASVSEPEPDPASTQGHVPRGSALRAWAELLRISAVFTVPGDALAGAAAAGRRPNRGTLLAAGASLCLYEAGMALNDYADRDVDAIERPHRPLPSGRISPGAALVAAAGLTAVGLSLAAAAGRKPLAVATALAGTVWAYDLHLKQTPAGPAAMAMARGLDLLLGSTATIGRAAGPIPRRERAAPGGPTGTEINAASPPAPRGPGGIPPVAGRGGSGA